MELQRRKVNTTKSKKRLTHTASVRLTLLRESLLLSSRGQQRRLEASDATQQRLFDALLFVQHASVLVLLLFETRLEEVRLTRGRRCRRRIALKVRDR